MSILCNGVLRTKLLIIPFACCCFSNLDFYLPHTVDFGDSIVLPFHVFNTFGSTFSVIFLHFKQYEDMFYKDLLSIFEKFRINLVLMSFLLGFLLDCCFKSLYFSATQLAHFDAYLITLFVIIVFSFELILLV